MRKPFHCRNFTIKVEGILKVHTIPPKLFCVYYTSGEYSPSPIVAVKIKLYQLLNCKCTFKGFDMSPSLEATYYVYNHNNFLLFQIA